LASRPAETGVSPSTSFAGSISVVGARLLLVADVHGGGGVLADKHRRETGPPAAAGHPRLDRLPHLGAHLLGDGLAVD
jgi:hypothetical protein